jgi:hypothetical protein
MFLEASLSGEVPSLIVEVMLRSTNCGRFVQRHITLHNQMTYRPLGMIVKMRDSFFEDFWPSPLGTAKIFLRIMNNLRTHWETIRPSLTFQIFLECLVNKFPTSKTT